MRSVAAVIMATLTLSTGDCSKPPATIPAVDAKPAPAAASTESAAQPVRRIWLDEDVARLVKSLGYDEAYVIRWENSEIRGWVEFDGEDGAKRVTLDSIPSDRREADVSPFPGTLSTGRAFGGKADTTATAMDSKRRSREEVASGWILVALRKDPGVPANAYQVRIEQGFRTEYDPGEAEKSLAGVPNLLGINTYKRNTAEGRLILGSPWTQNRSDSHLSFLKYRNGKDEPWLELRLADPSK
jgi:hypothetical protein